MRKNNNCLRMRMSLAAAVMSALASFAADPVVWEGSTNTLAMTAATTVDVPEGATNYVNRLTGAYLLTKTGGGTLVIRYVATAGASFAVDEGRLLFANPRPDDVFAKASFHVDASDLSTLTLEEVDGTNFVKRWNDADGRTRYATPSMETIYGRAEPSKRLPWLVKDELNGLPYVDFGPILIPGLEDENGVSKGYGAALQWSSDVNMAEGFSVVSDTPDVLTFSSKYSSLRSGYAMSFFSHWDGNKGWSGVRGRFSTTSGGNGPVLYTDNAQNSGNVYGTGCTNWVDGSVWNFNATYPAGFHLFNRSAKTVTVSRFAMEFVGNEYTAFGGTRIAEYAVFTNRLDAQSRLAVTGYLCAKWVLSNVPVNVMSVEVAEGASCIVDATTNVKVKSMHDANDGKYTYSGQTVSLGNVLYKVGAWIHLDASAANTMTISTENGTNFVTRWNDVDGGSQYAIPDTFTGSGDFRTNPENRRPYINPTLKQNGLPVVDLGSALFNNYTNENTYGAAFWFNGCTTSDRTPSVKEYLAVISDTEDLKTVPTGNKYGPAYFAYYGPASTSPRGGQMQGRRGAITANKNPPLFESTSSTASESNYRFKDDGTGGRTFVNGVNVSYTSNPPDGFNVINIRPGTATKLNLIGRYQRYASASSHFSTFGGQRIAEYMIFTSLLDDVKRERIYHALRVKWYGEEPLMRHGYKNLEVADDARVEVAWEGITVTNTLEIAGAVSAPVVKAGNVAATGADATIDGALMVPDGAALSFARQDVGAWTALSAKSLAAEGAVRVVLAAESDKGLGGTSARLVATETPMASIDGWTLEWDGKYEASLSLREDGVWVEFAKPGTVLVVE